MPHISLCLKPITKIADKTKPRTSPTILPSNQNFLLFMAFSLGDSIGGSVWGAFGGFFGSK